MAASTSLMAMSTRQHDWSGESRRSLQARHRGDGHTQHLPCAHGFLDWTHTEKTFELTAELGRAFVSNPLSRNSGAETFVGHQHPGFVQPDGLQILER